MNFEHHPFPLYNHDVHLKYHEAHHDRTGDCNPKFVVRSHQSKIGNKLMSFSFDLLKVLIKLPVGVRECQQHFPKRKLYHHQLIEQAEIHPQLASLNSQIVHRFRSIYRKMSVCRLTLLELKEEFVIKFLLTC